MYYNTELLELNDISLYYSEIDSVERSLEISKKINEPINKKFNIFIYWIGDDVNYKHSVVVKSFLATQNLNYATLKIYSDVDLSENEVFKNFKNIKNIEYHIFDVFEEIKGTIYENNFKYCEQIKNHTFNAAYESDFFRLLMLNKYGGFYIDFDVILLRDLSPLLKYNFLYQWGCYPNNMINGAVMHFEKDSRVNNMASIMLLNTPASPGSGSLSWASSIYINLKHCCPELVIFPSSFFNTEWQLSIPIEAFSKNEYSNMLFDGCFTWHWHNRWTNNIEKDSKFNILDNNLEKILNEKINEKYDNNI
jgi:hypothetical protein